MRPVRLKKPLYALLAAVLVLAAAGGLLAWRLLLPGLGFLGAMQRAEPAAATFTVEEYAIPQGVRSIPVRVYRPQVPARQAILVIHGVHTDGYREERLARFARELARRGYLVVAPDIEDLRLFTLTPTAVADIEASALFLLDDPHVQGARLPRKPGLFGISFAGGLGLSAAARPPLRHRLGFVFSFGGHGDLDRVMRYLTDGRLPDGTVLPPHLYGQAVLARILAERLVPAAQVAPLRASLLLFLQARNEPFQASLPALGPEARRVADLCNHWDAAGMGRMLAPTLAGSRTEPCMSPLRGPVPDCPVLLLHGGVDNVIPPGETQALAAWAAPRTPTRALVSNLIRHVELEDKQAGRPPLRETLDLLRFMTVFLRS
jgi:dienelactone hydrolase